MSSDDDPTKKIPEDEARYDTKPGITAVLERINQLGEALQAQIAEVRAEQAEMRKEQTEMRKEQAELRKEQSAMRTELDKGFRKVEQKIDLLVKNNFDLQTDYKLLESRVEKIEEKTS
jgi:chromosome segregation ATPase